jgi:hypothetical protein
MFAPKILSPELKDENGVAIDNNWWDTIKQIVSLTLKASLKTCLNMGILVAVTFGSINLAHTIAPNRVSDPFDLLASIETVKLSPEGVEFSREKEDDITSITKRISANKIQIDALSKSQVALIQQIKTYKSLGLDYRDTANAEKLISAKLLSVNANNLKLISELEKKFGKKINFDVKLYNRPDKALSP